jgi:hypothetical protein
MKIAQCLCARRPVLHPVLAAVLLLLLGGVRMAATTADIADTARGNLYVLAIGIDDYRHWTPLVTAAADATAVARSLQRNWGLEAKRTQVLINESASRETILRELRYLTLATEPNDSVIIFFAGHALVDRRTGEGAWIPGEAAKDDPSQWVSHLQVYSFLRTMPARAVLILSESIFWGDFFNGSAASRPELMGNPLREATAMRARQVVAGALTDQPRLPPAGFGGDFAGAVLAYLDNPYTALFTARSLHQSLLGAYLPAG